MFVHCLFSVFHLPEPVQGKYWRLSPVPVGFRWFDLPLKGRKIQKIFGAGKIRHDWGGGEKVIPVEAADS